MATLSGQDAISLWRKGRSEWATALSRHSIRTIDFSDCDFDQALEDEDETGPIEFVGYSFSGKSVIFSGAKFGGRSLNFSRATFAGGSLTFRDASINASAVLFVDAHFRDTKIDFYNATFAGGDTDFTGTRFERCLVDFSHAHFGEGGACFDNVRFEGGRLDFLDARFAGGDVSFQYATFGGPTHFENLRGLSNLSLLTFEGASFEKLFTFTSRERIGCPLDLRRTKPSHHIVLNDVSCDFVTEARQNFLGKLGVPPIAQDREDSQRFRRLKELALANRNHSKVLDFHVQEIRSRRSHETKWWQDVAQFFIGCSVTTAGALAAL
tara:strand:- start:3320 stop:4291 length:972 start_codon:yes stop_codon:yes gene_type:complete